MRESGASSEKSTVMSLPTTDLWLESDQDRALLENVVTGKKLLVPPADIHQALAASELAQDDLKRWEAPLLRSVDRAMREWSLHSEASPLQKLDQCREHCLSTVTLTGELERDLKAVFQTASAFLGEPTDRRFDFNPEFLTEIWRRPSLEFQYGQLPCMPETTQRRIELAEPHLRDESRGLILGDDDLMGLCWAAKTSRPCDIFEIDQRIVAFYSERKRSTLQVHQRDLTKGLPDEFHGLYDFIFTDPMYGRSGMDMFLTCCAQGLSTSPQARLFLSTRPDLIEGGEKLEERLASVGLKVLSHRQNFSRYRLPEQTRRMALDALRPSGLPRYLLRALLKVPYYYSDLLEVARL